MKRIDVLGIFTGSALGDGNIRDGKLVIRHSIKQKEYALYKAKLFREAGYKVSIKEKRDIPYPYVRLYILRNERAARVEKKIYFEGNKVLSEGILNQLQPIGLAIWYMDDGSLTIHKHKNGVIKSREIYWSTENFSTEDLDLFKSWLKRRYDIKCKIVPYKNYQRIAMNATNANKFFDIIRPYVIPSMKYKIDMHYSEKS